MKELPLVEELELSLCDNVGGSEVFEVVGQVCPQLKHFRLNKKGLILQCGEQETMSKGLQLCMGYDPCSFSAIFSQTWI